MFRITYGMAAAATVIAAFAGAAEPGTAPVPKSLTALQGCWKGTGVVMGKPVTVSLTAKPMLEDAMFAIDAESSAIADPKDRYSAHLLFGAGEQPGSITGFWADSFGGEYTATGQGESRPAGFDITYQYPGHAFLNRWRLANNTLSWEITQRNVKGKEKPFASYMLDRTACASS